MQNAGMAQSQAGIKIVRRNIKKLIYADEVTTLRAEREEELKSLFKRVKEESEKADLKLNIQETMVLGIRHQVASWHQVPSLQVK